jgi:glycosyltransferase involved in cell wall biosynthesis
VRPGTTAVIPAHTPRLADGSLLRAVESVLDQEHPVDAIAVAIDATGQGAAAARQRALDMAGNEWVAFLDADDRWHPNHLRVLHDLADRHDADYCYSWFDGNEALAGKWEHSHRGRQMDPDPAKAHHTTMTVMVRTELARQVGFRPHPEATEAWSAEDWLFTLHCLQRGAVFAGSGEVTWTYTADGANTSGLPSRWTPDRPQADVTVVVPHIPPRRGELLRALTSVAVQTTLPAAVSIAVDHGHDGSAATRSRALRAAHTRWVAFLDDDDALEVNHIAALVAHAEATGADVVYSGCTAVGPHGEILPDWEEWGRFGQPFDPGLLRQRSYLPVTSLVRADLAQAVGGFRFAPGNPYDDHAFYLALLDAGATFEHLPIRTWVWHHSGNNTSGRPDRW